MSLKSQVVSIKNLMEQIGNDIKNTVSELKNGCWEGPAFLSFSSNIEIVNSQISTINNHFEIYSAVAEMIEALELIIQHLEKKVKYRNTLEKVDLELDSEINRLEEEKKLKIQQIKQLLENIRLNNITTELIESANIMLRSTEEFIKQNNIQNVEMMDVTDGVGRISCVFDEYFYHPKGHKGIDIAAPEGTSVKSLGHGTVSEVAYNNARGYYLVINHGNGYKTLYQHLKERPSLKVGMEINTDDIIGKVGNTGKSTGPHLHLEVHVPSSEGTHRNWDGKKTLVDPTKFDYSKIQ